MNLIRCTVIMLATLIATGTVAHNPIDIQSPLLLSVATPRAKSEGWAEFQMSVGEYWWISSHELLVIKDIDNTRKLTRLDLTTGIESPLTGLTKSVNGGGGFEVSPDGKRVMWSNRSGKSNKWVISLLDGSNKVSWQRLKIGELDREDLYGWSSIHWTDNGKAAIEVSLEPDPKTQTPLCLITMKSIEPDQPPRRLARVPWPHTDWSPSPVIMDHNLLVAHDSSSVLQNRMTEDVNIFVLQLTGKGFTVKKWNVQLPKGANFYQAIPSPDGKMIAWGLGSPYNRHDTSTDKPHIPLGIWVSRIDGTGLREVGHLPEKGEDLRAQYQHLGGMKWFLDGKQLSFVYNKVLYTVPAF